MCNENRYPFRKDIEQYIGEQIRFLLRIPCILKDNLGI